MREARGGKMKMSVYLQDVHNHRINLENIPPELMDRFCQGNEEVQMEILQQVTKGNVVDAEVRPAIKKAPQPRMDANLISDISGMDKEQVKDLLKGDVVDVEVSQTHPIHDWIITIGGQKRMCIKCSAEREVLQPPDMTSVCSEQDGLY